LPEVQGSGQAVPMATFDTNLHFAVKLTIHFNANYLNYIPKLQWCLSRHDELHYRSTMT